MDELEIPISSSNGRRWTQIEENTMASKIKTSFFLSALILFICS